LGGGGLAGLGCGVGGGGVGGVGGCGVGTEILYAISMT
jgi:hypothetical protein